jgi:transcriptional regulator with XRE-family HTH domain
MLLAAIWKYGGRVSERRFKAGLTQTALADCPNLDRLYFARLERGLQNSNF